MKIKNKITLSFSLLALALGALFSVNNNNYEATQANSLCLGDATISEVKTMHPFDPENHNEFVWLIVKDADYPDVDGVSAPVDASKLAEFKDNFLSNIELKDSQGQDVSGVDIWEAYINMWTYHTNLALGFINGYDAWTINFKAGMKLPSYAYISGSSQDATYYTLKYDYTATRVTNNHTQNDFDTWTVEATSLCLGEATISEVKTMHPFDDPNNHNEFIWFIIKDADYPDIDGQIAPFGEAKINEFKAALLAGIELFDAGGNKVSGVDIWDAYINMWTYHTNLALGFINGYNADTIKVKAGTKIPSYAYISGSSTEPTYYKIANDYTFNRVTNNHAFNDFDTWSMDDEDLCLGEATISEVKTMHPFDDPNNHNEFIWFIIKDADYPDIDGQIAQFGEAKLNEFKANFLANIEIKNADNQPVEGLDIWDAYINMWTYHTNLALGYINGYDAHVITIKKGMKLPSYAYICGTSTSPTYYTVKEEVTFTRTSSSHTFNDFDSWMKGTISPDFKEDRGEVTISSFQSIYPNMSGDSGFSWLVIKDADYPDIDGISASCEGEAKTYFANEILTHTKLFDKDGNQITDVAVEQITVNMWTYHTNIAILFNKNNLAEKIEFQAGMKLPSYRSIIGEDPFSYYTLKYDYEANRLSRASQSTDFEKWDIARTYEENVDLYDELISEGAAVLWPHVNESAEGSGNPDCFGTQIHFPLNSINLIPNSTNETYFNDHGSEFPIDLMAHILINGVSMRDLVTVNASTNEYTYLWGTMKSHYAPCYLALFRDAEMAHGARLLFGCAEAYAPAEGMEITFTPFSGYGNSDNQGVYLSKAVTFKIIDGELRRLANIQFGSTTVQAPVGLPLDASLIPSAGEPREPEQHITYTAEWAIEGSDPQIIIDGNYVVTGDIVCVPVEVAHDNYYTVTFDTVGGSAVESQSVIHNGKAIRPEDPTKDGYTFAGWYVGDEPYNFDSEIVGDITITAHWEVVIGNHNVTFDSNGGSSVAPIAVPDGSTVTRPEDPTRDGYTFDGWFLDGELYDFSTPVTGDITLVAQWTRIPDTFTVTFDSNGGSSVAAAVVTEGETVTRPSDPLKDGAVFDGWYLDGELYDFSTPVTGDITLVAHWIETEVFTVTFDTDGGSSVGEALVNDGQTVAKPADPIKNGYTFDGWYLDGKLYDFSTPVTGDITLVAHWRENQQSGSVGCGGSIATASGIIALVSLLGIGLIASKKKED